MQGLLWVWPDASPAAAAESAAAAAAVIPEGDDPGAWLARTGWFMRDVPCGMETVVENVTVGGWPLIGGLRVGGMHRQSMPTECVDQQNQPVATATPPQDPCHAPFTHHGVQGRRDHEKGTVIRPAGAPTKAGFECAQDTSTPFGGFKATFAFTAPCLVK